MKKSYWLVAMMLVLALFLAACGGDDSEEQSEEEGTEEDSSEEESTEEESEETEEESEEAAGDGPVQGGTLVYAIDSEPSGPLDINFYGSATEAEINQFVQEGFIEYDEEFNPIPHLAEWETEDEQVFNFKIQEGVKWHNGDELTVHDWVFALETLAHPDYTGPRWSNVQTVEGAVDFRNGDADEISGLNVISDYEIEITFDQPRVNNLINLWTYPMNQSHFEGIEVAEMEESPQAQTEIVGTGPFVMVNSSAGEYYELEKNPDYWQGEPNLDGLTVRVVANTSVIGALENEEIDMVPLHPTQGEEAGTLENVEVITYPGVSFYYVGFKLGVFDNDAKEIVEEKDKYANKQLRQALWHAIDREEWIDAFFGGYGKVLNAPIPTSHWIAADNSELNQYEYDPEKAKELLEEAGYVDVNDDGFVEDPDGNEFVVNFSHYDTGNPTFETRAQAIVQYWQDVGVNAELTMVEVSNYYDMIDNDDPAIEAYFAGWSVGADPDPTALWGSDQLWNQPRWNNEESDQLMADALDVDIVGGDDDKRLEIYTEWQQLFNEEAPGLIITELEEVYAVNNRVGGLEYDVTGFNNAMNWYVTDGADK